jgi:hypothetical protein
MPPDFVKSYKQAALDRDISYMIYWNMFSMNSYESCRQLGISHSEVTWLHADVREQVDRLYAENGDFPGGRAGVLSIEQWPKSSEHEPIQCFQHSLSIYDRQTFPEFWATLQ